MDPATATMIKNLEEKTGKTLAQWVAVVKGLGAKKHGEIVSFLKETHQLGHGYAPLVAHSAAGREITTLQGLGTPENLHPLQLSFSELGAAQCGYCTPGMIIASESLLRKNPSPSEDELRHALSGNLCRCTGYVKIFEAVNAAAEVMRNSGDPK